MAFPFGHSSPGGVCRNVLVGGALSCCAAVVSFALLSPPVGGSVRAGEVVFVVGCVQCEELMYTVDVIFGERDVDLSVAEAGRRLDCATRAGPLRAAWVAVGIAVGVLYAARSYEVVR